MIRQILMMIIDDVYEEIEVYLEGENKHIPDYIVTFKELEQMGFGC